MPCQDAWIVDDSATARRLIDAHVAGAGFASVLFENGAEAARAIVDATPPPGLVILDMQMDGLDGCATARAIRRAGYAGAVVLQTAATGPALARRALHSGIDQILEKDSGFASLRRWLNDAAAAETAPSTPHEPDGSLTTGDGPSTTGAG